MATTLSNPRTQSPYHTSYTLTGGDGAANPLDYTVDLAATFLPGPLKTLLAKLNASGSLDHLNTGNAQSRLVTIRRIEGATAAQTAPLTKDLHWTANGLSVQAAAGSVCEIEIRLAQSAER